MAFAIAPELLAGAGESGGGLMGLLGGGGTGGIGSLMNSAMGRGIGFQAGKDLIGGGGAPAGSSVADAGAEQSYMGVVGAYEFWGSNDGSPLPDELIYGDSEIKTAVSWYEEKKKSEPKPQPPPNSNEDDDPSHGGDMCTSCGGKIRGGACRECGRKTATENTFGEESVGLGTKNRGDNSDPDQQSSSGADTKERGDAPEQLKDVGTGDAKGDPGAEDSLSEQHGGHTPSDIATTAFWANLPLVLEFAAKEDSGEDHPILQGLDQLLEEAFPGYRNLEDALNIDGEGPDTSSTDMMEEELDQDEPEEETAEDLPPDPRESSRNLWAAYDKVGYGPQIMGGPPPTVDPAWPNSGMPAADAQPGSAGDMACPACGNTHAAGVPCPISPANPMTATQPGAGMEGLAIGVSPMTPPSPQKIMTKYQIVSATVEHSNDLEQGPMRHNDEHHNNSYEDGVDETGWYEDWKPEEENSDSPWIDDNDEPLQEGVEYELHSGEYAVPDRITVQHVTPDKLNFILHSGDLDYSDEITIEDLHTLGYSFTRPEDGKTDSESGFDLEGANPDEAPIRPGQDPTPQVDDLSVPQTHVGHNPYDEPPSHDIDYGPELPTDDGDIEAPYICVNCGTPHGGKDYDMSQGKCHSCGEDLIDVNDEGRGPTDEEYYRDHPREFEGSLEEYTGSYQGDNPDSRDWLKEGSSDPVDVDPSLMAKLAGKNFTPSEERAFINEAGEARNLERLELEGTHYEDDLGSDSYGDTLW